jgi:hypothetical protein
MHFLVRPPTPPPLPFLNAARQVCSRLHTPVALCQGPRMGLDTVHSPDDGWLTITKGGMPLLSQHGTSHF